MSRPADEKANPELRLLGRALSILRAEKRIGREKASEAFGTSVQNWGKYERGEASTLFNPDVQRRLTQALGSDVEELQLVRARLAGEPERGASNGVFDFRSVHRGDGPTSMLIRHRIQAAWVLDDEGAVFGHYHLARDPRYALAEQWLAEVLDDSAQGLGIIRGDLVQLVAAGEISYWPRTGDIVEVERRREGDERELTLRQVEISGDQVLLWPRSPNPRLREPLQLPADPLSAPEGPRILSLLVGSTRKF